MQDGAQSLRREAGDDSDDFQSATSGGDGASDEHNMSLDGDDDQARLHHPPPVSATPVSQISSNGGVIWQTSADFPEPVPMSATAVDRSLFVSTEPTLPNDVKRKPHDPDMNYLYQRSSNDAIPQPLRIDTRRPRAAELSTSPPRATKAAPQALLAKTELQALSDELVRSRFSDVPLRLSTAQAKVAPVAPESISSSNKTTTVAANSDADQKAPPSTKTAPALPRAPPGDVHQAFIRDWLNLPPWPRWHVFLWIVYWVSEVLDLLLSSIYLVTYDVGCYALVTPFEGGLQYSYTLFYVALSATAIGYGLFAWKAHLLRATLVNSKNMWLNTILAHSELEWGSLSDNHVNQFKVIELTKLLFKDSVMMFVVTANLGPYDANLMTMTKLLLSAHYLARYGTHMFLILSLRLCCACCIKTDFHRTKTFLASKYLLTVCAFAMWMTPAVMMLVYPGMLKHIHLTDSQPSTATLYIMCVPPPPGATTTTFPYCDPSVCKHRLGQFASYPSYLIPSSAMTTFSNATICAMQQLDAQRLSNGEYQLTVPGAPAPLHLHMHMPCQLPITYNGTRFPDTSWSNGLFVPVASDPSSLSASVGQYFAQLQALDPIVYQNYSQWIRQGTPQRYSASDQVQSESVCTRAWTINTSAAAGGPLDLQASGLLQSSEINVPNQHYMAAIDITQIDQSTGPLSCSFDYVGLVRKTVQTVGGQKQLEAMAKDMKRLLSPSS
ncbi:hypothetical protein RI367_008087 [Sorochytrium milnesiophthora]